MKFRSFVVATFGVALLAGLTACAPEPPPPTTPTDPWVAAQGTCFRYFSSLSYKYNGPKNTYGNAPYYRNATCSGTPSLPGNSFVEATSATQASTICNSIKPPGDTTVYFAANISTFVTPASPSPNLYSCSA